MSTKREREPMTESDFAAKIDWEGGITDALDYGLTAEHCEPGPLRDAWEKLELKWAAMQEEVEDVEAILEQYQEGYEEGDR